MKVARFRGENNIAKPIMMLTIITLIGKGKIIGNKISYNDELVMTYNRIFKSFRTSYITSSIYPFYYLNSEEFYYIKGDTSRKTPSARFLRENVEYAALDDQFWNMLQDTEIREEFKMTIINRYLK